MRVLTRIFFLSIVFIVTACSGHSNDGEAKLRALDNAYVAGWMLIGSDAQEAAIMPLLTDDAVIMPGLGTDPSYGKVAIRQFWFPDGAPPTNTTEFDHSPNDIMIEGNLGVISGRYVLKFEYDGANYHQVGNYLIVAERQSDGDWLASKLIWNDRRVDG